MHKNFKKNIIIALILIISISIITILLFKHNNDVKHQEKISSQEKKQSIDEDKKKEEKITISKAAKNPNDNSIITSTSKQIIQKNNFSNVFINKLNKNHIPIKIQTILLNKHTATIILQDDVKQKDINTYLNNYAKATAIALQAANQNSNYKITTLKIARQISLKNGSQFGIATLWTGDQFNNNTNLNIKNVTADTLIPNASRYEFSGSIWSNFDQKQKNIYTNHIINGKSEDNTDFNTWFDNSTCEKNN